MAYITERTDSMWRTLAAAATHAPWREGRYQSLRRLRDALLSPNTMASLPGSCQARQSSTTWSYIARSGEANFRSRLLAIYSKAAA